MQPLGPDQQTLRHEAMATTFTIVIAQAEPAYARQAAAAAFAELDRIEGCLSRFVQSSDVFRINRLAPGQTTVVQLDTFECLRISLELQQATRGAFDVTFASAGPLTTEPRLVLSAEHHTVGVLADGVRVDLGGIGKGFALDRMAALLADWDIEHALLAASSSTVLALGPPPGECGWPASVGPDHERRHLKLVRRALSGSGTAVQGPHIIDPRTGQPASEWTRAWAGAPTAALADALSTALMVMSESEIRACCCDWPEISAYVLRRPRDPLLAIAEECEECKNLCQNYRTPVGRPEDIGAANGSRTGSKTA